MNALANAIAHGPATAIPKTSDVAKTREGKGRDNTTPQGIWVAKFQDQGLLSQGAATTSRPRMVLPVIGLGGKR